MDIMRTILNLVQENAGEAIVNNPAVPNEKNNEAIQETGNSIMGSLKNQFSSGNGSSNLISMFTAGQDNSNPVVSNITGDVTNSLIKSLGLSEGVAGGIAAQIIPAVMKQFVNKTNDPNDSSLNLDGILKAFLK